MVYVILIAAVATKRSRKYERIVSRMNDLHWYTVSIVTPARRLRHFQTLLNDKDVAAANPGSPQGNRRARRIISNVLRAHLRQQHGDVPWEQIALTRLPDPGLICAQP